MVKILWYENGSIYKGYVQFINDWLVRNGIGQMIYKVKNG